MKKLTILLLALALVLGLAACAAEPEPTPAPEPTPVSEPAPAPEPEPEPDPVEVESNLIGVSMPTKDLSRWNQGGNNMKEQLEAAGYEVDLKFAANDPSLQVSQIESMVANGAKVLVIAAIDGEELIPVLAQAKEAGVTVIAYDRLLMGSDAVNYYVGFDIAAVGEKQAQYIVDALDLDNAPEGTSYNIEYAFLYTFDVYAELLSYHNAMSVLQPYIDAGVLITQSGQTDLMEVTTAAGWDAAADAAADTQNRFENILATYYTDKPLHAVMASYDSVAQGVTAALSTSYSSDIYPIITGQDLDIISVGNMLEGKQAMSVFKDTRDLAAMAAEMVDAIMKGEKPPINDEETYGNGTGIIPAYLCEPKVCDINNYKEFLIGFDYYTEADLAG